MINRNDARFRFVLIVVLFGCVPASASFAFDAAADFSNLNNPTGAWSYCADDATVCTLFSNNSSVTGTTWAGDFNVFGTQTRWSNGTGAPEAIALSDGSANTLDLPNGDVFGHAQFDIRWTAPFDGVFDIIGGSWMARDLGRTEDVTILLNGVSLYTVQLCGASFGCGTTGSSASPILFSSAVTGLSVTTGDHIDFFVAPHGGTNGDYVGLDISIGTPEPSAVLLGGTGLMLLLIRVLYARRGRAS